jgi:hypothetical protein
LDRLTRFASSRVILNHKQPDPPVMDQIALEIIYERRSRPLQATSRLRSG